MSDLKVAVIQMNPVADVKKNLETALSFVIQAAEAGAGLVVLPELFFFRGNTDLYPEVAIDSDSYIFSVFCSLAKYLHIDIVLGSVIEQDSSGNLFDTAYVISREGDIKTKYRKNNLFYVCLENGTVLDESALFAAGKERSVFEVDSINFGMGICFDLRFPKLFSDYVDNGVEAFCLPSDFTYETGRDHWHSLVRGRAIETQSFVLAANCCGVNEFTEVESFGHSMIVDPWGTVLAEAEKEEAVLLCDIDIQAVKSTRKKLPLNRKRL